MSHKASTVRVLPYTKELILKHTKRLKISQDELIYKAILVAETHNFSEETQLKQIEKLQIKETNRLIGFLKTQDKNLLQTEQNIYSFFDEKIRREDKETIVDLVVNKSKPLLKRGAKEYFQGDENRVNDFMNQYEEISKLFFDALIKNVGKIQ